MKDVSKRAYSNRKMKNFLDNPEVGSDDKFCVEKLEVIELSTVGYIIRLEQKIFLFRQNKVANSGSIIFMKN